MKTKVTPSRNARSLLVTFYEGFSTYTITIPMPYAIRFFADGLVTALNTLEANDETKKLLEAKEGEKAEIQDLIRRAVGFYEDYLNKSGR